MIDFRPPTAHYMMSRNGAEINHGGRSGGTGVQGRRIDSWGEDEGRRHTSWVTGNPWAGAPVWTAAKQSNDQCGAETDQRCRPSEARVRNPEATRTPATNYSRSPNGLRRAGAAGANFSCYNNRAVFTRTRAKFLMNKLGKTFTQHQEIRTTRQRRK